jgi:hypothetical protein
MEDKDKKEVEKQLPVWAVKLTKLMENKQKTSKN